MSSPGSDDENSPPVPRTLPKQGVFAPAPNNNNNNNAMVNCTSSSDQIDNSDEEQAQEKHWPNVQVNADDIKDLIADDVKFSKNDLIATGRSPDGKVVFLETGNEKAGLRHILSAHGKHFADAGIPEDQVPELVMKAVTQGKVVGKQGKGDGRPIYQVEFGGHTHRIAVTTGKNGYIVGANPAGRVKNEND